jgi:release factor glutamine methyltransferase
MTRTSAKLVTIAEAQQWAWQELAVSDTAALDADVLLAYVLTTTRVYLIAHRENLLTAEQVTQYQALIRRRKQHEPIAYIVGHKDFWTFDLEVTSATLIPRPETELLVETVLQKVKKENAVVADLGTGSGAIALALATEKPKWQIIAVDCSEAALQVAMRNAERLAIKNIRFLKNNWLEGLPTMKLDAIVSNPPYISEAEWPSCAADLSFEPRTALVSANEGLQDIKQIIAQSSQYLCNHGLLFLEHGSTQASKIQSILAENGYTLISSLSDLAGKERVTSALWLCD